MKHWNRLLSLKPTLNSCKLISTETQTPTQLNQSSRGRSQVSFYQRMKLLTNELLETQSQFISHYHPAAHNQHHYCHGRPHIHSLPGLRWLSRRQMVVYNRKGVKMWRSFQRHFQPSGAKGSSEERREATGQNRLGLYWKTHQNMMVRGGSTQHLLLRPRDPDSCIQRISKETEDYQLIHRLHHRVK